MKARSASRAFIVFRRKATVTREQYHSVMLPSANEQDQLLKYLQTISSARVFHHNLTKPMMPRPVPKLPAGGAAAIFAVYCKCHGDHPDVNQFTLF